MKSIETSTRAAIGIALSALALTAWAADPTPTTDAKAHYEQERARCMSGRSGQDQATCLKEAGAALDASKQGMLNNDDHAKDRKDAKSRCDVLTGDDKRDCLARVKDAANTTESGSVKGGGILRETKTIEVVPASAPSAR